ncbi:MAG: 5-formyltetrahydrofolate cyclo-ligase [Proteobacteria bacterium]|nr:5-formyltetrahydrofolate cyclo-ligase [Pseudomonadota bacterium]
MTAAADLIEQKRRLRAEALARRKRARATLAADIAAAGARLCRHFLDAFDPRPGTVVSGFWPIGDEIDVGPLLAALDRRGCVVGLPVVVGRGQPLLFRRWRPGARFVSGPMGTREPAPDCPEVAPTLVIVPLLAFDSAGRRLGYGAGYYDRTLSGLRARGPVVAAGVAFAAQEVAEVPAGAGDERLDWVVTEERARRCAGAAAGGRDGR